jgi:hypothetical protein
MNPVGIFDGTLILLALEEFIAMPQTARFGTVGDAAVEVMPPHPPPHRVEAEAEAMPVVAPS